MTKPRTICSKNNLLINTQHKIQKYGRLCLKYALKMKLKENTYKKIMMKFINKK